MDLHNLCYRAAKIKYIEFHRTVDLPTFFYRQFVFFVIKTQ
jgi:hypothetical protein